MPPKLQIRFGNHAAKDLGPVLSCDRIQSTGRAQTDPFQGIVYGSEIVLAQVALLEGHSYNQNIKAKKKPSPGGLKTFVVWRTALLRAGHFRNAPNGCQAES